MSSSPLIGIDLGTTYSCIAVFRKGKVEVIPDQDGYKKMPSMVAFDGAMRLVGFSAFNQKMENVENTVHGKDFNLLLNL